MMNVKIAVPLKYLSSFWRSWRNKITSTKLFVPIVTLSTKDNVSLIKQLNGGFKRPVCWNEYKAKIESINLDKNNLTRFCLDASFY